MDMKRKHGFLLIAIIISLFLNFIFLASFIVNLTYEVEEESSYENPAILKHPLQLQGNKVLTEISRPLAPDTLKDTESIVVTFNLHGLCALDGEAFSMSFESREGNKRSVSLERYGKNCYDGEQSVTIPITDFFPVGFSSQVSRLMVRVWYPTSYVVDITKIYANTRILGAKTSRRIRPKKNTQTPTLRPSQTPTPSPTPTVTLSQTPTIFAFIPTLTPLPQGSWQIQSVSSMKETKDRVCNQRQSDFIERWVDTAKELGVNYVAVETPYDSPTCGDSVSYTKSWINIIRSRGLRVWHRHMPLSFEGIYDTIKDPAKNYLELIRKYIGSNPNIFKEGDIFTPIPEPQNGGVRGVTYCPQSICIFGNASIFNQWLRDAIDVSEDAFSTIGLAGKMKIGYYGFDGFVAWGDNNPDWEGILEDATVAKMGNITIDHYPEIVGDTMENDLNELQVKYPNTPIIIGEWGTISGGNTEQQVLQSMQAAKRQNVVGLMYWHMGMGGYESLVEENFAKRPQFDEVQSFFLHY